MLYHIILHCSIVGWSPISLWLVEINQAIAVENDSPTLVFIGGDVTFRSLLPPFFFTGLSYMWLVDGNTEREFA